jgi:hypothetical protein
MSGTPRPDRGGGFGPVRIIANPAFFFIYSSNFKKTVKNLLMQILGFNESIYTINTF